jgi:hypothetical protein
MSLSRLHLEGQEFGLAVGDDGFEVRLEKTADSNGELGFQAGHSG